MTSRAKHPLWEIRWLCEHGGFVIKQRIATGKTIRVRCPAHTVTEEDNPGAFPKEGASSHGPPDILVKFDKAVKFVMAQSTPADAGDK